MPKFGDMSSLGRVERVVHQVFIATPGSRFSNGTDLAQTPDFRGRASIFILYPRPLISHVARARLLA